MKICKYAKLTSAQFLRNFETIFLFYSFCVCVSLYLLILLIISWPNGFSDESYFETFSSSSFSFDFLGSLGECLRNYCHNLL